MQQVFPLQSSIPKSDEEDLDERVAISAVVRKKPVPSIYELEAALTDNQVTTNNIDEKTGSLESKTSQPLYYGLKRWKFIVIVSVSAVVVVYFIIFAIVYIYLRQTKSTYRKIELYGDSLVNHPCKNYDMDVQLTNNLTSSKPDYDIEVTCDGENGQEIAYFLANLDKKVFNTNHEFTLESFFSWQLDDHEIPDAVILYWDSDELNGAPIVRDPMNATKIHLYTQHLSETIERILHHGILLFITGPTLGGELPRGRNHPDAVLDYYAHLNNITAAKYNVTYINTRNIFFDHLPSDWNHSSGWLTEGNTLNTGGEHPNINGSKLLSDTFHEVLLSKVAASLWS